MSDKPLKSQIAIVTGASSGIGSGVAEAIGRAGASVVVNYRSDEAGAAKTVEAIEASGGKAFAMKADVAKEDEVAKLFEQTIERWGRVDIVVANSGIQKDAAFVDMTLDDWKAVIDVNLTGQFLTCRAAVRAFCDQPEKPGLSRARGKIVCMSSVHEVIPWAGHVNYAASKGGVLLMMKSLAQEVASKKIRVNGVAPGAIKTPINEDAWKTEEARRELLRLIPYGRIGEPEDIGRATVWLASDDSDYITGTTLFVDGGMTLYPGFQDAG